MSAHEQLLDQELVREAQAGNVKAFELLVSKYQRRLERLLSRLIRDEHEVRDVAQEAFIKAYRALPTFRGDSAFYTWLYRIGVNTAKNYLASGGKKPLLESDYGKEGEEADLLDQAIDDETPESFLINKEIMRTVEAAIRKLPEELRQAITLRELEGLSYEEIAQAMQCPIGTVRSRIFRAREVIAKDLRPLLDTTDNRRW